MSLLYFIKKYPSNCEIISGGLVLDRCNRYSLLFMVITAMAIGIGAMPWCRHLWMLIVSSSLIGIGGGVLDTGASVLCLELWGRDSGPYMQAMHFTFALGGSVAPLLVQAFIGNTEVPTASPYSSRHVRSITEPFNLTDSSDAFNETLSRVLDAVTPSQFDLITSTQPFNGTETFNATTTTTTPTIRNAVSSAKVLLRHSNRLPSFLWPDLWATIKL